MREALLIPLLLGVAYAAAPGVVNTECLRRGISSGFRPAFLVQVGALLGDGVWAVIAFSGLSALSRVSSLLDVVGLAGGLYLCKLALDAFRDAVHGRQDVDATVGTQPLRTGLIFGLANPAALAFWSGLGGGMLSIQGQPSLAVLAGFLVAFLAGAVLWSLAFSTLASAGRRYARPRIFQVVDGLCGMIIGFFGVRLAWTSARRLLRVV
jgi:threonine/homoserine/homoserine lactone efflux protein